MHLNPFTVESVCRTQYDDATIEISERISLHGQPGEMASVLQKLLSLPLMYGFIM